MCGEGEWEHPSQNWGGEDLLPPPPHFVGCGEGGVRERRGRVVGFFFLFYFFFFFFFPPPRSLQPLFEAVQSCLGPVRGKKGGSTPLRRLVVAHVRWWR